MALLLRVLLTNKSRINKQPHPVTGIEWKTLMTTNTIRFLHNDQLVELNNLDPNLTILQYLREEQHATGTKEGCASGDCGACTVVLAEPDGDKLSYKSVNSCIGFVGSLHGKQLITVEHLKDGDKLHPVQQSLVDNHGSQCGFCTPGFVMSAFALHKHNDSPNRAEVVEALAGNLCRCTGYRSIIDAAMTPTKDTAKDAFVKNTKKTIKQLNQITEPANLNGNNHQFYAPTNIKDLAKHLVDNPKSTLLAGGTDLALGVTQNLSTIEQLVYLGNVVELNQIEQTNTHIKLGAAVTYSRFTNLLGEQYPDLAQMIERIGSTQIRNSGTLGGNIGNASPIGDMPPAMIALNATMTLRKGEKTREIAVEDYFKDYKVTDLEKSEFIQDISIPKAQDGQHFKVYKVSKRIDDDISAVLASILIEIDGKKVKSVSMAFGGMAAIPKRAKACEKALLGKPWTQTNVDKAKKALAKDFQPMSDVRASDAYRMKVAQNLLQKCFIELQNRTIETRVANYA